MNDRNHGVGLVKRNGYAFTGPNRVTLDLRDFYVQVNHDNLFLTLRPALYEFGKLDALGC